MRKQRIRPAAQKRASGMKSVVTGALNTYLGVTNKIADKIQKALPTQPVRRAPRRRSK